MTDRCELCGRFIKYEWATYHCLVCLEMLTAEGNEAEAGIGTGSVGKADLNYCRHLIERRC